MWSRNWTVQYWSRRLEGALQRVRRTTLGAGQERRPARRRSPVCRCYRRSEPAVPVRGGRTQQSLREDPRAAHLPEDLRLREGGGAGVAPGRPDPRRVPHLLRAPAPRRRRDPLPPATRGLLRQGGTPRPARLPPLRADRRGSGREPRLHHQRHRGRHGGRAAGNSRMSGPPDWRVGDGLEERALPPINRGQLGRYAEASGDPNPIHLSDDAAEDAGLPGIIAHGMLTVATMGLLFSPYLEHGYIKTFRSRFSGMVFLDDVLRVGGRVIGREEIGEGLLYTFEVYARREEDTVASGEVGFLVAPYSPERSDQW